jgi:hypothetical protein
MAGCAIATLYRSVKVTLLPVRPMTRTISPSPQAGSRHFRRKPRYPEVQKHPAGGRIKVGPVQVQVPLHRGHEPVIQRVGGIHGLTSEH